MRKYRSDQEYTQESLQQERKYGLFWYSWLWTALRPALLALCVLLVVTGVVMGVWNWVNRHYFAPVNVQDDREVVFIVSSGNSLTRVANNLEDAGLIHNRTVFKYYADFLGYGQKIQSGEYKVKRSMSMREIMELLTTGDGNPITRNITIIPGWTIPDIAKYLKDQGVIEDESAFLSLCQSGRNYAAFYYISDLLATPNAGYRFVKWSDENIDASRTVTVTGDMAFTATFVSTEGIDDVASANLNIFATNGRICVTLDGQTTDEFSVYDVMGRRAAHVIASDKSPVLPAGVYMVKVGTLPARKVVVIR